MTTKKNQETIDFTIRIVGAFVDLMDGKKEHDIQAETGLPEARCKEIYALYQELLKKQK